MQIKPIKLLPKTDEEQKSGKLIQKIKRKEIEPRKGGAKEQKGRKIAKPVTQIKQLNKQKKGGK